MLGKNIPAKIAEYCNSYDLSTRPNIDMVIFIERATHDYFLSKISFMFCENWFIIYLWFKAVWLSKRPVVNGCIFSEKKYTWLTFTEKMTIESKCM